MYQLWASMLTTRTWDKILSASDDLDRLRNTGSDDDFSESRYYARQYAMEIGDILRKIPRELLLILKTNDNLRSIDLALGCPVNNFVTTARYVQRALNEEHRANHPGVWSAVRVRYDTAMLEARLAAFSAFTSVIRTLAWSLKALGLAGGRRYSQRASPGDSAAGAAASSSELSLKGVELR